MKIAINETNMQYVVTADGRRVTFYNMHARGEYPIHGFIHNDNSDAVCSWKADGKNSTAVAAMDLVEWSMEKNFPWNTLPAWANLCVFKSEGVWYCASVKPTWSEEKWRFVAGKHGETLALPSVITDGIMVVPHDPETVFLNPKYPSYD